MHHAELHCTGESSPDLGDSCAQRGCRGGWREASGDAGGMFQRRLDGGTRGGRRGGLRGGWRLDGGIRGGKQQSKASKQASQAKQSNKASNARKTSSSKQGQQSKQASKQASKATKQSNKATKQSNKAGTKRAYACNNLAQRPPPGVGVTTWKIPRSRDMSTLLWGKPNSCSA